MKTSKLTILISAILMGNTMQPMMRQSMVHLKQCSAMSRFVTVCKAYMQNIVDPQKPQSPSAEQSTSACEQACEVDLNNPEFDPYSDMRIARRAAMLKRLEQEREESIRFRKQLIRDQETKRILEQRKFEIAQAQVAASYMHKR